MRSTLLCALAVFSLAGAACTSSSIGGGVTNTGVNTEASSTTPAAGGTTSVAPSTSKAPAPKAHVGSTIHLKGEKDGEAVDVTLVALKPVKSSDGFSAPDAGKQFVGAQWRLTNVGTVAYDDSPTNGTVLIDPAGEQFESGIVSSISAGAMMPSEVKIPVGGKALGYIVYQVPKTVTVSGAQFSLDSGFGNAGQWDVP